MNVQLFNFHAAGSSVRSSSLTTSNESPEPPGSLSSTILCKSWNKGHCFGAAFVQALLGLHHAPTSLLKTAGTVFMKCRSRSPSASGSGSQAKARRGWLALVASEMFWWRCLLVALHSVVNFSRDYWLVVIYMYRLISLLTRNAGSSAPPHPLVLFLFLFPSVAYVVIFHHH